MTNASMVGDESGIALWNLMASTNDKLEQKYFASLNSAASKFGSVWFTDSITQRVSKSNQTVWNLLWNDKKTQWEVSLFHVPEGAERVTARIKGEKPEEEIIELDLDDLLIDED